jgi:Tol biopolymer transport system component
MDKEIPDLFTDCLMNSFRHNTATPGNRDCYNPSLNATGTVVAFATDADYFGQNIPQYQFEVWLYDTVAMTLTRVTYASDSDRASDRTTVSTDGLTLAFHSVSDLLGENILDSRDEIWIARLGHRVYLPLVLK